MLKGVNKQIIEIVNPESSFFERAILFVAPNKYYLSDSEKNFQAKKYLKSIDTGRCKSKKAAILSLGKLAAAAAAGAAVCAMIRF